MELLHELAEIPLAALSGEFEIHLPHASAENRVPVVHVGSGRHPKGQKER